MTLGELVDFTLSYNERQKKAEEALNRASEPRKQKPRTKYRMATQEEINAYFG